MKSAKDRLMPLMAAWGFVSLAVSAVSTLGQQQRSDGKATVEHQAEIAAAVKYDFDHFQGPSGMLPRGHHRFIELKRGRKGGHH